MTKVPSLGYEKVIKALKRNGWVIVRRSHIRLHKHLEKRNLKADDTSSPSNQKVDTFAHPETGQNIDRYLSSTG